MQVHCIVPNISPLNTVTAYSLCQIRGKSTLIILLPFGLYTVTFQPSMMILKAQSSFFAYLLA